MVQRTKNSFFSDRLKEEAADWHTEIVENLTLAPDYDDWKKSLLERFLDASDKEQTKMKLFCLNAKTRAKD